MTSRRRRKPILWALPVLAVVGIVLGAGTPIMQPTAATTDSVAVFYSGKGCAGLNKAGAAVRLLRATSGRCWPLSGGLGVYDGRWTSDTPCDATAATTPTDVDGRTINQLVGYSLGRLGPLYFLAASTAPAVSNIRSIIMIDPGSSEITSNDCDTSATLDASGLLRDWLRQNPANRLTILAGTDTQADGYKGIKTVYLKNLSPAELIDQTAVCAANLNHDDMMTKFAPVIGSAVTGACPSPSADVNMAPTPADTTAAAPAPATSTTPPAPTEPSQPPTVTVPDPTPTQPTQDPPTPDAPEPTITAPTDDPPPAALPVYTVMNTNNGVTEGVWFRYAPYSDQTTRTTGLGVYADEQVQLQCYGWGDVVGPYGNSLWYYVVDLSRPTNDGASNEGWLNAHYIDDNALANEVDYGVPAC